MTDNKPTGKYGKPSRLAFYINWSLLLLIFAINCFVLWGLFGPKLELSVKSVTTDPPKIEALQADTSANRLLIPSIFLNAKINDGPDESSLIGGVWRRPATSTPDQGGNTVIAGHRFTYKGKSIFYNLDRVKINDEIGVTYAGKLYRYRVKEIRIVPPTDGTIEAPKNDNILTLYTCTPLWTSKERLVVIAGLEERDMR